ncbi:hypothetical protein KAU33_06300 [Candidatus Dependentiae bacterium]|nr:hypothetical protein [Candidatus Dependentiae bacterium]
MNFNKAKKKFENNKIRELSQTSAGLKFLKLRSLSRKDQMEYLADSIDLDISNIKTRKLLEYFYNNEISDTKINSVIRELYDSKRRLRR